ncbi:MAG: roadblock/LC7 domain-containing protein [Planctomycetota bacterium]|nr:roadblock/LC7 domain-containing protein [Planctomycetota bacterium]
MTRGHGPDRTVFYAREIHQMNLVLGKFLQKSGAETVLLVDVAGHLLTRQGAQSPASEDTITALVAGNCAASRAMATMLGTQEFSSCIRRGGGGHLLLLPAGDGMLAVAFGDDTSVSLVRTYALEAVRRLNPILTRELGDPATGEERIEKDRFEAEIDDALTDVFG